jgi:hypothetical protein
MPTKNTKKRVKKSMKKVKTSGRPMWQKALVAAFILAFGVLGGSLLIRSFAATAPLYLSPETQTVQQGSTFTVDVRMSMSTAVDSVTAHITYDPTVMDFVSVNGANSVFPTQLAMTGGNGTVQIDRGTFTPQVYPAGSLIATITFSAKTSVNGSPLQMSGNVAYQGQYLNPGTSGANVVISDPTPPSNGDITKPVVTIAQPASGDTPSKNKFVISASATDDVGVSNMQVIIDGSVVLNSSSSQVGYTWNVAGKKVTKGDHTILVRATDAAGNVGSSSVTVRN